MSYRLLIFLLIPLSLISGYRAGADDTSDFYAKQGAQLYKQGRYTEAVSAFDQAIKSSPRFAALYAQRAGALMKCNDYAQASTNMLMAIKLDPKNVDYCLRYAQLGEIAAKTSQELDGFTRALALEPQNTFVLLERARAYRSIRDFDHALQDYNAAFVVLLKAGANRDDLADAYRERGLVWVFKKDYAHAISDFNNGIKYGPHNTALIRNRADAYAVCGQYEKAVEDLSRCMELDPKLGSRLEALRHRAMCYLSLKNYPKAIADANRLVGALPDDVNALILRAKIYTASGKSDLAKKDSEAIAKLQADMAPPKY